MTLAEKFAAEHADEFEQFKTAQEEIQAREAAKREAELKAEATRVRHEFGQRLKAARQAVKLKQLDVARRLHIPPSTFASYEQGRNDPSLPKLMQLCKVLNVSPNELLGWKSCT